MNKYVRCPVCGKRVKREYGTRLQEHHNSRGFLCRNYWTVGEGATPDPAPVAPASEPVQVGQPSGTTGAAQPAASEQSGGHQPS